MKKALILLFTLVIMTTIIGCSPDETDKADESDKADETNKASQIKAASIGEEFKIGEKLIVINSVEKFIQFNDEGNYENDEETQEAEEAQKPIQTPEIEEYGEQEGIALNMEWTNNSDGSMSFSDSIYIIVFQDGIELDPIYRNDEEYNESKNIRPGTTLDIRKAYLPRNTNAIEIEVIGYDVNDNKTVTFVIKTDFPQ